MLAGSELHFSLKAGSTGEVWFSVSSGVFIVYFR